MATKRPSHPLVCGPLMGMTNDHVLGLGPASGVDHFGVHRRHVARQHYALIDLAKIV